ncbi:MAG: phosphatidate cytidylyltransferase, partial [Planctomycetota bacterium]
LSFEIFSGDPTIEDRESDNPKKSLSVAMRTLIGIALAIITVSLLWVDHAGSEFLSPGVFRDMMANGLVMALVTSLVVWLGLGEYAGLAAGTGVTLPWLGLAAVGSVVVLLQWAGWAALAGGFEACPTWLQQPGVTVMVAMAGATLSVVGWRAIRGKVKGTAGSMAHFSGGLCYVMLPLSFLGGIRVNWGTSAVLTLLVVSKFTDVGAYYVGKTVGGPKLAPVVSPNKSWAGALGGMLAATVVAVLLSQLGWTRLAGGEAVAYGILMSVGCIVADLAESALKREAGLKDSANLIPGSGGILDVADDVLFAAPFTYLFFALLY